jgi:hypothetical protein
MIRLWFLGIIPFVVLGDYFKQFEDSFAAEETRRNAGKVLEKDLLGGFDTPKEIEIVCQGTPTVSVKDMIAEAASVHGDKECTTLRVKGESFHFELSLNCGNDEEWKDSNGESLYE